MNTIDFSRHDGLLDHSLMQSSTIAAVGAGGAAGLYRTLAGCGLGHLIVVDHDEVSTTNPATQAYGMHQVGQKKVVALAHDIENINPECCVTAHPCKIEKLSSMAQQEFFKADLVLAMTDDFNVQSGLNKQAIQHQKDILLSGSYAQAAAIEISGSFPDSIAAGMGCHRCHTFDRYQGFEEGYEPPVTINSHLMQAEYRNACLGNLILSLLHFRAGSDLGSPSLAESFLKSPFLISRLNPVWQSAENEGFAEFNHKHLFPKKHWPSALPVGCVCTDCGAMNVSNVGHQL